MNDELVTWLRAQLDKDERVAKRAGVHHPSWAYDRETFTVSSDGGWSIAARKDDGSPINDVDGEHITNHDPARALAEVDAKRRTLDRCVHYLRYEDYGGPLAEEVLALLALPYAGRPGYRREWAPDA
ncbi:DUF6221 family protein [Micromonospora sp. DT44]|uniref:DUF6221 family protein n=1 Tax=Micromonospora sp. DT44 TaxID=3393439 RepID=UPI003CF34AFD